MVVWAAGATLAHDTPGTRIQHTAHVHTLTLDTLNIFAYHSNTVHAKLLSMLKAREIEDL